jgi:hypothetical protein
MSTLSTNQFEDKPISSTAQKITAAASVYSAAKLHSLEKSSNAILETQQISANLLNSIDGQISLLNEVTDRLASIQNSSLNQLQIKNERDRLRDQIDDYRHQVNELRREQKIAEEEELQHCKDTIHNLNREAQLIVKSDNTNVEKALILEAMNETVSIFSATQFKDISDKEYLNKTEDLISETLKVVKDDFVEQDTLDYEQVCKLKKVSFSTEVNRHYNELKRIQEKIKVISQLKDEVLKTEKLDDAKFEESRKALKKIGVKI